jgi:hypothetical protein
MTHVSNLTESEEQKQSPRMAVFENLAMQEVWNGKAGNESPCQSLAKERLPLKKRSDLHARACQTSDTGPFLSPQEVALARSTLVHWRPRE